MTDILKYIVFLDVFALTIMSISAIFNHRLKKRQRVLFAITFITIAFISICELIEVSLRGADVKYRNLSILFNFLKFGLTPYVPLMFSMSIDSEKKHSVSLIAAIIYDIVIISTYPMGLIFRVDENNVYSRGSMYEIYVAMYVVFTVLLFLDTLKIAKKYRGKSGLLLFLNLIFFIVGTSFQVLNSKLILSWLCVTLVAITYYVCCNGIWNQIDGLTGILNQEAYIRHTEKTVKDGTLILFDIDGFKNINDNYGHIAGDDCLVSIARIISENYGAYGLCYRIGGDEFAAILKKGSYDLDELNKNFEKSVLDEQLEHNYFPDISLGCYKYSSQENMRIIKEIADSKMYECKRQHREKLKALNKKSNDG